MFKCIKESFNLTNKYIILATPLILFSLISSLYVLFSLGGNLFGLAFAAILFVLMLCAFLSGWFFMIRKGITSNEYDEDPNSLIKEFPAGVGEYFLSAVGMVFTMFLVVLLFLILSYFIGMQFIGDIGISSESFSKAISSVDALKTFLYSLSEEQLLKLNAWNLLLLATMFITYFMLMLYPPAMFFKSSNPFKAYVISLKNLFSKRFIKNVLIYLMLFLSYFVLSILTTIFAANVVTHFIFTLINFYYLVFVGVLIFNYYHTNYLEEQK